MRSVSATAHRIMAAIKASEPIDGKDIAEIIEAVLFDRDTMMAVLRDVDACFQGRDADGAPSADGTYWLGHSTALKVWYALHPEKLSTTPPEDLDF